MGTSRWTQDVADLSASELTEFLVRNSGLPGPRANLELAMTAAERADPALADHWLESGDEYLAMCAAVAFGRRADATSLSRARALASDSRWRVREGVAIGLQLLGDRDFEGVASVVLDWVASDDPLVQRAAVAAICEPRLLRDPAHAGVAIEACERATDSLAGLPRERRREPSVRTLRQALGYCWSVAVAADPEPGLAAFRALDTRDADVRWIVNENLRKKRLASLL